MAATAGVKVGRGPVPALQIFQLPQGNRPFTRLDKPWNMIVNVAGADMAWQVATERAIIAFWPKHIVSLGRP